MIIEFIIGKPKYVGHKYAMITGEPIYAYQLDGVSTLGASKYIFKDKQVIEKIFSL